MDRAQPSRRIEGKFNRGARIIFRFDGRDIEAYAGESIAAALAAAGERTTRTSPSGAPRGAFCLMGSCQECAVRIDDRKVLACMTEASEGLVVESDRVRA